MNKNMAFLLIAVLAVAFLVLAGFSLGMNSVLGFILSMFTSFMIVGIGFMLKRKWRAEDQQN